MNEPTVMYTIKPIIRFTEDIDVPKCMYGMKNIQKSLAVFDSQKSEQKMPPTISEQVKKLLKCPLPEVCVLESRQEAILEQLNQLKKQMAALRLELSQSMPTSPRMKRTISTPSTVQSGAIHDVVINVSPKHPPFSLLALYQLWGDMLKLRISCHVHSTITQLPDNLASFQSPVNTSSKTAPLLNITIIWKDVGVDTELIVSPIKHVGVRGEVNILRYLMRLGPPQFNYELTDDPATATALDGVMDACYQVARGGDSVKEQRAFLELLGGRLGKSGFVLHRKSLSMADLAAWSVLRQLCCQMDSTVAAWFQNCCSVLKLGT